MFDVAGACDMHIHTGPDFVERVGDDFEVAAACEKAGMKAILLKTIWSRLSAVLTMRRRPFRR